MNDIPWTTIIAVGGAVIALAIVGILLAWAPEYIQEITDRVGW